MAIQPDRPPRGKWYHNFWLDLVMLFFVLGPFGLPMVWKNPRFSPSVKWMLTLLTLVYTAWLVLVTMSAMQTILHSVNQFNSHLGL